MSVDCMDPFIIAMVTNYRFCNLSERGGKASHRLMLKLRLKLILYIYINTPNIIIYFIYYIYISVDIKIL